MSMDRTELREDYFTEVAPDDVVAIVRAAAEGAYIEHPRSQRVAQAREWRTSEQRRHEAEEVVALGALGQSLGGKP